MEESYRFYTNKSCKYLPCHKAENLEDFNCMFCYCPLYLLEDCGGKYKMKSGIKNCIDCVIPHTPSGYDYINKKIVELNREKKKGFAEEKDI